MATAPLSLYAETPEEQSAVQQYRDAQKTLLESLEGRKQLFDPTLLAMAQGFLSPTKTGSFGEALGNVAERVAPVQEAESKRAQEIAKMRYELAQQNLVQQRASSGDKMFAELAGRVGSDGINVPQGAPVKGDAFMPSRDPSALVGQAQQGMRDITPQDIAMLAKKSPENAKILSDMVKMQQDRFSIAMNGIVFDKAKGQYLNIDIPGQKQEDFATPYGTFKMTPNEYARFQNAEASGVGKVWLDNFRRPGGMASPSTAPGRQTVSEQAAESEAAKTKATETAKAETGRTQSMIESGRDVTGRLVSYQTLRDIASRPDSKEIFGILNRPDVGSAILNLVNEGVRTQSGSIQAGALEDTFRNLGLPQAQIDRYRFALATMANIQLQQAKLAAGQGAVSNFERDLFANATISPKDNPQTILAKLSMLEARANFDRRVASALRSSKMSADDFMDSEQYEKMQREYLSSISRISSGFGGPAKAKPAAQMSQKFELIGVERQ